MDKAHALAILLASALVCAAATHPEPPAVSGREAVPRTGGANQAFHIYLLIGQSNMAGRAPFSKEDAKAIERCYLLNDKDNWEPARNPLNRYSTIRKKVGMQRLNPGYTFALAMLEHDKDTSIGLVVNARGGTKIEQWKRGTRYYQEALRKLRVARESGTLRGILWHQGEGDANNENYVEELATLIGHLREDLDAPELPFVAGQINTKEGAAFNERLDALPERVPFARVAKADGLEVMDRWHFDTQSMKELGRRYAKAMLAIQDERSPRAAADKPPTQTTQPARSGKDR